jgi:anti-sigma regulatory factor (Ser/Thr protein kinase)
MNSLVTAPQGIAGQTYSHMTVAYSTRDAAQRPLAADLCEELRERGALDGLDDVAVEIALHEAIANAVQHGNLELGSALRDTVPGQGTYAGYLAARLNEPRFGDRTVHIHARWKPGCLCLSVTDEGRGYSPQDSVDALGGRKCSGRGLFLIGDLARMVNISKGGRCLTMEFGS